MRVGDHHGERGAAARLRRLGRRRDGDRIGHRFAVMVGPATAPHDRAVPVPRGTNYGAAFDRGVGGP
jgi:hypothetical protein